MDDKKFEILLEEDRNWLSKYGGIISFLITILLIAQITYVKIPQYQDIHKEDGVFSIHLTDKSPIEFEKGQTVSAKDLEGNSKTFIVSNVSKTSIQFKQSEPITGHKSYRIITHEQSLLMYLIGSLTSLR